MTSHHRSSPRPASMGRRRIVTNDDQDVHTGWRRLYTTYKRAGQSAKAKRRTRRRECLCADDHDHDRTPGHCTCECGCDEYAWWANGTKSGHEVTWVRWSWTKSKAQVYRPVPSTPEEG